MKKIAILSGKFSIGVLSSLEALYELIEINNWTAFFIINDEYKHYIDTNKYKNIIEINNINNLFIDCLIIYNISFYDRTIIKKLKRINHKIKVIFIYHEPWRGYWLEFKRQKSFRNYLKTFGRKILSMQILKMVDEIWLPSEMAKVEYCKIDYKFNNNYYVFPLIFRDELNFSIKLKDKKFFSYIATVDSSRRFNDFLAFIKKYSNKKSEFKFLIATKSNLNKYIDKDLKNMIDKKQLVIIHNHNLTTEEINDAYYKSWCVWLLYETSTQSGVLCKSFMFGTPVIASNIEAFREYIDNSTSAIINDYRDMENIFNEALYIKRNLNELSENARKKFLNTFYYKKMKDVFRKKIESLTGSEDNI